MCSQTTSKDTHNAISSPVSADGLTPLDSRCGMTLDLFGQEVAPVNPSAKQGTKPRNRMSATYGLIGLGSSESAALQRFLVSRLKTALPLDGLMMSAAIWKRPTTPARRQYCQLIVPKRRMKEIGYGLYLTPTATMTLEDPEKMKARRVKNGYKNGTIIGSLLSQLVYRPLYVTLSTSDAKGAGRNRYKGSPESHGNLRENLRTSMEDGQYIHPNFAAWMMGYDMRHLKFAPTAMPSSRKSRQSSSKQQTGGE